MTAEQSAKPARQKVAKRKINDSASRSITTLPVFPTPGNATPMGLAFARPFFW